MNYSDKQFNKIINKLKVDISNDGDKVFVNFDNDYFMVDGTYDVLSDHLELEFWMEDVEKELTEKQTKTIFKEIQYKIDEYNASKTEIIQLIRYSEIGY